MDGCYAILVAAGRGRRLGGDQPKQYRKLGGWAVLRYSAEIFSRHQQIAGTRVVIHPDDRSLYDSAVAGLDLLEPVAGGDTRQESVRRGLDSLAPQAPDRVLIHDAARPFVDGDTISRTIAALAKKPGALVALPVVDTVKRAADGIVGETVNRAGLWRAQTPQGFRYKDIVSAHAAAAGHALTDDAAIAERAGLDVAIVEGREENFKVTTEEDLRRAQRVLAGERGGVVVTGMGFDVHRFGPGDHVWLCGLRIPHDRGLIGHSDADVGLHAITDAILGALGAGDIGSHFSDKDARWKDASSDRFLKHAAELATGRGGTVVHVDLTLICEAPRIGPHRAAMVARIAEILGLPEHRVSVKATTTETLGFTGRGEGIAGQAVATVRLPG